MKFAYAALFLSFAASALAQDLTIATPVPGVTACEPFLIKWSGGTPNYFLDLLDGNNFDGAPLAALQSNVGAVEYTWTPTQAPGTKLVFQIRDSRGASQKSGIFNVIQGGSTGCVGGAGASGSPAASTTAAGGAGGATDSTTAAGGQTTTAAGGQTTTAAGGSSTAKTGTSASGSPSPKPTGGALARSVPIVGVLVAAAAVIVL